MNSGLLPAKESINSDECVGFFVRIKDQKEKRREEKKKERKKASKMSSGPLAQLVHPLKKLHVHFPVLCIGVYGLTRVPSPYTWEFSFLFSPSGSRFPTHFLALIL